MNTIFAILASLLLSSTVFAAGSKVRMSKDESLKAVAIGIQWAVSNQSKLPDAISDENREAMSGYTSLQIIANLNEKLVNVKRMGIVRTKDSDRGVECLKENGVITCESMEFEKAGNEETGGGSLEVYKIELKIQKHEHGYEELIVTKTEVTMAG